MKTVLHREEAGRPSDQWLLQALTVAACCLTNFTDLFSEHTKTSLFQKELWFRNEIMYIKRILLGHWKANWVAFFTPLQIYWIGFESEHWLVST